MPNALLDGRRCLACEQLRDSTGQQAEQRIQALERWRKYLTLARGNPEEENWVARAEEHLQHLQRP